MTINRRDLLIHTWLQKSARNYLLSSQDNAISAPNPDGSSPVLNSLGSIFYLQYVSENTPEPWSENEIGAENHLEIPAIGRKDRIRKIVASANGRLRWVE